MKALLLLGAAVLAAVIDGWLLMLLVGILHVWWAVIPTMAFRTAFHVNVVVELGVILAMAAKAIIEVVVD